MKFGCVVVATVRALSAPGNGQSLSSLEVRLGGLEAASLGKLERFYDDKLSSFVVESGVDRFSVTSTCYAVSALLPRDPKVSAAALLGAEWRENDLFQLPLVVHAVASIVEKTGETLDDRGRSRLGDAVATLISSRVRLRDNWKQNLSCYLQFWLAASLAKVLEVEELSGTSDAAALSLALGRAHQIARNELCRQIAYHASGERTWFDVVRLAYSLLTYTLVVESCGKKKVELIDADDAEISSRVNEKLCRRALAAFFEEQLPDGLWPPGEAIYLRSRRSFDLGNAFVFSPDVLGTLMDVLPAVYFLPHLDKLEKLVTWLEEHEYEDGWRSNHLATSETRQVAVAWSTAQTLKCATAGRKTAQALLNADILREFGGQQMPKDLSLWQNLLDSDMGRAKETTLKRVIQDRVIDPRRETSDSPMAYSAVLFGPPGTAKTTTAEAVARALGYGFVVVDTATFLEEGVNNVAARIAYVFSRLERLENCVILFDEIEEFCLDRSKTSLAMESRMLTTAMLTQLNDLRRARRSLFFIATNRLADFDAAITRPGRVDLLLFVGTPNVAARVERFRSKLPAEDPVAIATFAAFLESTWEADSKYLNFLESERFADAAVKQPDNLGSLLEQQLSVMVLRDARARRDFDAGTEATRL